MRTAIAALAILLGGGAAQAQITTRGEREVCVANATQTLVRAEVDHGLADDFTNLAPGARHCRRFPRTHTVQVQAEAFVNGAWAPACPERPSPAALGSITYTVERAGAGFLTCR